MLVRPTQQQGSERLLFAFFAYLNLTPTQHILSPSLIAFSLWLLVRTSSCSYGSFKSNSSLSCNGKNSFNSSSKSNLPGSIIRIYVKQRYGKASLSHRPYG